MRHIIVRGVTAGLLAVLAACGTASPESVDVPASDPPSSATEKAIESVAPSLSACPNEFGGECLGELAAGTYSTLTFESSFTYTVTDGWGNYEDLPGNFLLIPPSASLEGADAGTDDYAGMYDGTAAASADCQEIPQAGVDATPHAMTEWYRELDGLDVTEPRTAEIGGLEGLVIDIRLAAGWDGTCPYPGYEDVPMVPMLIGTAPASAHHVVTGETVTRLYLLDGPMDRTIAIELSDTPGGASMEELDGVVATFDFTPG